MRLILIILAAVLLTACTQRQDPASYAPSPFEDIYNVHSAELSPPLPLLNCIYYEHDRFLPAVTAPPKYTVNGVVLAGLVPHHLLASDMIAGFFAAVNNKNFDRVLIVAPSHFPENCRSDVVTALADWETPFGISLASREIIGLILGDELLQAENNPAAVEYDHGVAGLVPFVKYYLPDAEIAVCLLSNNLSVEKRTQAVQLLGDAAEFGRTLLVASADFSHYLTPSLSELRDAETATAIEAFDYERIRRFKDSNIDSPQTLETLLAYTERRGLSLSQLDHSSSNQKLPFGDSHPIYYEGVTTYFVYAALQ